jgi:molybdopterin molybdotransferase
VISEAETLDCILASITPFGPSAAIPVLDALGRFTTTSVLARLPIPRFDHASVDGFAVPADVDEGSTLRLVAEQPAGIDRRLTLHPQECIRIFTGAPLPSETQAVVMQEDVSVSAKNVHLRMPVSAGDGIRRAGADVCEGQKILSPGDQITPAIVGLLASQGVTSIEAGPTPWLTILSTGDELLPPGAALADGQIYESNSLLLDALFRRHGFANTIRHHLPDDPAVLTAALDQALAKSDAIIFSGGVSVGDRDFVNEALKRCRVETHLWRVNLKPGNPFLFGTRDARPVFGLPGNPVSSFVTAILFVLPALRRLAGASLDACMNRFVPVPLAADAENPGSRPHYLRGVLGPDGFTPSGLQESHALRSLASARALARLEPNVSLPKNSLVPTIVL